MENEDEGWVYLDDLRLPEEKYDTKDGFVVRRPVAPLYYKYIGQRLFWAIKRNDRFLSATVLDEKTKAEAEKYHSCYNGRTAFGTFLITKDLEKKILSLMIKEDDGWEYIGDVRKSTKVHDHEHLPLYLKYVDNKPILKVLYKEQLEEIKLLGERKTVMFDFAGYTYNAIIISNKITLSIPEGVVDIITT